MTEHSEEDDFIEESIRSAVKDKHLAECYISVYRGRRKHGESPQDAVNYFNDLMSDIKKALKTKPRSHAVANRKP